MSARPAHRRAPRGLACTVLLAGSLAVSLAGCAGLAPPQPWEKGDLARRDMQLDARPLEARGTEHIYQSKEAAGGGYGVGGGGCGCN